MKTTVHHRHPYIMLSQVRVYRIGKSAVHYQFCAGATDMGVGTAVARACRTEPEMRATSKDCVNQIRLAKRQNSMVNPRPLHRKIPGARPEDAQRHGREGQRLITTSIK